MAPRFERRTSSSERRVPEPLRRTSTGSADPLSRSRRSRTPEPPSARPVVTSRGRQLVLREPAGGEADLITRIRDETGGITNGARRRREGGRDLRRAQDQLPRLSRRLQARRGDDDESPRTNSPAGCSRAHRQHAIERDVTRASPLRETGDSVWISRAAARTRGRVEGNRARTSQAIASKEEPTTTKEPPLGSLDEPALMEGYFPAPNRSPHSPPPPRSDHRPRSGPAPQHRFPRRRPGTRREVSVGRAGGALGPRTPQWKSRREGPSMTRASARPTVKPHRTRPPVERARRSERVHEVHGGCGRVGGGRGRRVATRIPAREAAPEAEKRGAPRADRQRVPPRYTGTVPEGATR